LEKVGIAVHHLLFHLAIIYVCFDADMLLQEK
jgi:hypothetical protein